MHKSLFFLSALLCPLPLTAVQAAPMFPSQKEVEWEFWIRIGSVDIVMDMIIDFPHTVNVLDEKDKSPLMWACIEGNLEIVQLLIEGGGADVDLPNSIGMTALMYATLFRHFDIVQYLVEVKNANIHLKNKSEETPLLIATRNRYGEPEIVRFLIQKGAQVEVQGNNGYTPLINATLFGGADIVRCLIELGRVDVNRPNSRGDTALKVAVITDKPEIMALLLKAGARIDPIDNGGNTPFMIACAYGRSDMVKYLHQKGAQINQQNKERSRITGLMLASLNGHVHVVKYLVQAGAQVDLQTTQGYTALMLAAIQGNLLSIQYLVEIGHARLDLRNRDGHTALNLALLRMDAPNPTLEEKQIADYLLQANLHA